MPIVPWQFSQESMVLRYRLLKVERRRLSQNNRAARRQVQGTSQPKLSLSNEVPGTNGAVAMS